MKPTRISQLLAAALLLCSPLAAFQAAENNDIVTDIIFRDKKGKPLPAGAAIQFELSDNGAKQSPKQVRHVSGDAATVDGQAQPLPPVNRLRTIALVLTGASPGDKQVLLKQMQEFFKTETNPKHFYGVFFINFQLSVLQPFTNDRAAVLRALEQWASSGATYFFEENAKQREWAAAEAVKSASPITDADLSDAALATSQNVRSHMARYTLEAARYNAALSAEQGSRATVESLNSFASAGRIHPGRKSVVYIGWGIFIPYELDPLFRNLMSRANRNQVAFYTFNIGGAGNVGSGEAARAALASTPSSGGTETISTIPGTREFDRAENGLRTNTDGQMRVLSETTGGTFTTGTNDVRETMARIAEDADNYTEVVYDPGITNFDGSLRKIAVKPITKDVRARSRENYFAIENKILALGDVNSYELPILKALEAKPLPRDLEFRSGTVRLKPEANQTNAIVLLEYPFASLAFTEDAKAKVHRARLGMLVLIKDQKGQVAQKFTRDLPVAVKPEQLQAIKSSSFRFREQFAVPPGRYTIETAVLDQTTGKVGARRSSFVATSAATETIAMTAPVLVNGFEANAKDLAPTEPFQYQGGRVTPSLGTTVRAVKGAQMALFFTVYPIKGNAEKPITSVEYVKDGNVVGSAKLDLPPVDAQGRIPYILSSPAEAMPPGAYEIRLSVKQGASEAKETAFVTIEQ